MLAGLVPGTVAVVAVERAPAPQCGEQHLRVLGRHCAGEAIGADGLGQHVRDGAVEVCLHRAVALRLAAERADAVQIGVVVDLDERLERHAEALAVIQQAAVVVGDAPRPRVEIQAGIELAVLHGAAHFGVAVAAAQRPGASAGAVVVFQQLDPVAGPAQLHRGHHAGHTRAQHEHAGAVRAAVQLERAAIGALLGMAEGGHGHIHRSPAGRGADQAEEIAARRGSVCRHRARHTPNCPICQQARPLATLLPQRPHRGVPEEPTA